MIVLPLGVPLDFRGEGDDFVSGATDLLVGDGWFGEGHLDVASPRDRARGVGRDIGTEELEVLRDAGVGGCEKSEQANGQEYKEKDQRNASPEEDGGAFSFHGVHGIGRVVKSRGEFRNKLG